MSGVKSLEELTKHGAEQASKKAMGEEIEELEATGQEDERKASKWVKEKGEENKKELDKVQEDRLGVLDKQTSYKFEDYKRILAKYIHQELLSTDIPQGYLLRPFVTEEGVGLAMQTPDKRKFVRAFAPVNKPKFDMNAVELLVIAAENKIIALEEEKKNASVIIGPNGRTK